MKKILVPALTILIIVLAVFCGFLLINKERANLEPVQTGETENPPAGGGTTETTRLAPYSFEFRVYNHLEYIFDSAHHNLFLYDSGGMDFDRINGPLVVVNTITGVKKELGRYWGFMPISQNEVLVVADSNEKVPISDYCLKNPNDLDCEQPLPGSPKYIAKLSILNFETGKVTPTTVQGMYGGIFKLKDGRIILAETACSSSEIQCNGPFHTFDLKTRSMSPSVIVDNSEFALPKFFWPWVRTDNPPTAKDLIGSFEMVKLYARWVPYDVITGYYIDTILVEFK